MAEFKKYQHVERFGTSEVKDIELGECYVFPKIDGTNASVWLGNDGTIQAGSRKRHLSIENDNAGFCAYAEKQENLINYLKANPTHRLFGEWLVPHSLRTYRKTAWNKFYIFDVIDDLKPDQHLPFSKYVHLLDAYNIEYILPIAVLENGTHEQFVQQLKKNSYLIEDGNGVGEGIVIKNYDYFNEYGRQIWAKIVTSEFKEKHTKKEGAPEIKGKKVIEQEIAKKYVTTALCEKVRAKIENDNNGFAGKQIPQLLNTVYHDVVIEESWHIIKQYKNPVIDFKKLQKFVFLQVKEVMNELF